MWVEVDLRGVMRAIPSRVFKGRIQRVMDIEMAAIKVAVESLIPGGTWTPSGEARRTSVHSRSTG